jgi:hypothetical protein
MSGESQRDEHIQAQRPPTQLLGDYSSQWCTARVSSHELFAPVPCTGTGKSRLPVLKLSYQPRRALPRVQPPLVSV